MEFDLENFQSYSDIVNKTNIIIARKYSGKRVLVNDILARLHDEDIKRVCILSDTNLPDIHQFESNICNTKFYDIDHVEDISKYILDDQIFRIKHENYSKLAIVFDDIVSYNEMLSCKSVQSLVRDHKILGVTIVICVHSIEQIPSYVDNMISNLFVLGILTKYSSSQMYDRFFNKNGTMPQFESCMGKYTQNYGCVVKLKDEIPQWYQARMS